MFVVLLLVAYPFGSAVKQLVRPILLLIFPIILGQVFLLFRFACDDVSTSCPLYYSVATSLAEESGLFLTVYAFGLAFIAFTIGLFIPERLSVPGRILPKLLRSLCLLMLGCGIGMQLARFVLFRLAH